ncbi:MAG: hypothetical protein ACRD2B_00160 [Terriglobia bacterium]
MEKNWVRSELPLEAQNFLYIATFLPVRRWRFVLPFIQLSMQIEKQVRQSPGLLRYGLKTNLPRKHFWTLSVWTHRAEVSSFVDSEPHATAVKQFERWAGAGAAFVEWESSTLENSWETALEKLKGPTFYYRGKEAK